MKRNENKIARSLVRFRHVKKLQRHMNLKQKIELRWIRSRSSLKQKREGFPPSLSHRPLERIATPESSFRTNCLSLFSRSQMAEDTEKSPAKRKAFNLIISFYQNDTFKQEVLTLSCRKRNNVRFDRVFKKNPTEVWPRESIQHIIFKYIQRN